MSKSRPSAPDKRPARRSAGPTSDDQVHYSRGTRETVESIVVAIILAFLFRSFVAEAFVIPTGSMAPTLQGKHKDVRCVKCNFPYRAGASDEDRVGVSGEYGRPAFVVSTTCPNCRFTMNLDSENLNHVSFTGDRILVSKFSYDLGEPKRWDVIVFKYPGNAKQNYIKRLVGLPEETVRIRHGDVFVKGPDEDAFRIARKPEPKLLAMLQVVHDADFVATQLREAGWPSRWQPWGASGDTPVWSEHDDRRGFSARGNSQQPAWLRYQHVVPLHEDWYELENGRRIPPAAQLQGQLITDFYAYNAYGTGHDLREVTPGALGDQPDRATLGMHWVGDLAMECQVQVQGDQGALLLKLVEGGIHFDCRIDVANGQAELSMTGGPGGFDGDGGSETLVERPTAATQVRGPGVYNLRMANVDDEIWLWVNNRRVRFSSPTTFAGPQDLRPRWSPEEYGDLAPAGIGTQGLDLDVKHLRILRDVYYVAARGGPDTDHHYPRYINESEIVSIFSDPTTWESSALFNWDAAGPLEFQNGADQFFPMGDNSPRSQDARLWASDPWVERDLLTGKALLIYWPHAWNSPVPFLPNFQRMGFIR